MKVNNMETSKFWTYLSGLLAFEAPLWNWRQRLGGDMDFELFRETYLLPKDKFAWLIICPKRCDHACGFRKIRENDDGSQKAVCHKNKKESFVIAKNEVLMYGVNYGVLLPEIAQTLGIQSIIAPFQTWEEAWEMGTIKIGNRILPVFFTLRNWDYKVIDLIFDLNCMVNGQYILLVTSGEVISQTSVKALERNGSLFIPLNEVLDFNQKAELMLIRPLDSYLETLQPDPPYVEAEPDNIFRKCGDAWEVRFAGGEKFMLTTGNTGASYLHFMLARPNVATPVIEIMRSISGESENYVASDHIDMDDFSDGFSFRDAPITEADNIADETSIRKYREEIKLLSGEWDAAKASGDNITAQQLEADLERLTAAIYEAVAPDGQRKKLADQMKRLVDAFRASVNFTIEKIAIHDVQLAEHLILRVRHGQNPGYFSPEDVNWHL